MTVTEIRCDICGKKLEATPGYCDLLFSPRGSASNALRQTIQTEYNLCNYHACCVAEYIANMMNDEKERE